MNKLITTLIALLAIVVVGGAAAATSTVAITRAGFVPETVTIRVGDTVTWTNQDTQPHQVVSQERSGAFSSPVLQPGQSFSHVFGGAGRFTVTDPLNRNRRMTVVVSTPAPTINLAAQPRIIVYGGTTTITGSLSSQRAGERVTLFEQACGRAFERTAATTTGTGGTFTFTVKPLSATSYRVEAADTTSAVVAVRVQPRLRLARVAPKTYSLRVFAATSFAGKAALFQRYSVIRRAWLRVRTVTLATTGGVAPTIISSARFRARVRSGVRVRAVLGQPQVGDCYLPGRSNTIRS